jgi:hypothetical protein
MWTSPSDVVGSRRMCLAATVEMRLDACKRMVAACGNNANGAPKTDTELAAYVAAAKQHYDADKTAAKYRAANQ